MAAAVSAAVFPHRCLSCRRLFRPDFEAITAPDPPLFDPASLSGRHFCPDCDHGPKPVSSPFCTVCGDMFKSRVGEDHVCGRCLEKPPPFSMARAAAVFDDPLKTAIHELKYRGRIDLTGTLGSLLLEAYVRFFGEEAFDILVPVPLHGRRLRKRGFNQAHLLSVRAADTARRRELPLLPPVTHEVLVRIQNTPTQTGLSVAERRKNIKKAFAVPRPPEVKGLRILLVDDVLTTGATASECARVLKRAGAESVYVLTVARALSFPVVHADRKPEPEPVF